MFKKLLGITKLEDEIKKQQDKIDYLNEEVDLCRETQSKTYYIINSLVDAVDTLQFLSSQFDSGQAGSKDNYPAIKKVFEIVDDIRHFWLLSEYEIENPKRVYKVDLSTKIVLDEQEMKSDCEKQPSGYEGDFDGYCQQVAECLATGEPDDIEFYGTQRIA
jgi:hypothetical protein